MEKTDKTVTERKKCIWLTLAVTVSSYAQEKQELPCGKKPSLNQSRAFTQSPRGRR